MTKGVMKRCKWPAIVVLVGLLVWLGSSALVAWKFTRRAGTLSSEPLPQVPWADLEEHRLKTSDGEDIGAWLVRGDSRKGCILLLHGNGGTRSEMLPVMQTLVETKFSMMAITLRAHGDSSGEFNDIGWSARHDVVAAVAFLQRERPGQPIYIVGRSLGAAAAIFAAGELKGSVAGYFLEQPYKDLESAVGNRLRHHLPRVLDWTAYLGLRLWATVFLPVSPGRISPEEHLMDIPQGVPVVFISGSIDRHAPLVDVEAMCHRIESHSHLVVFDGAVHEPLDRYDPGLYKTTLLQFLGQRQFLP